jgi:Phage capsid family
MLEQIREQLRQLLEQKERLRKQEAQARTDRRSSDVKVVGAALNQLDLEIQGLQARKTELEELEARTAQRTRDAGTTDGAPVSDYPVRTFGKQDRDFTYRPDQPGVSFFCDAYAAHRGIASSAQSERLGRHQREVQTGAHGEFRDVGVSAFAGLVPPNYLAEEYAPNVAAGRITANLAGQHDLPDTGMTVVVPRGTTSARVAAQATEGTGVQETNHGDADVTINVNTYAGQQNLSRQSLERGIGTDTIIFQELVEDYAAKSDQDVIGGPGSGGRHQGILGTTGIHDVKAKGTNHVPSTGRQTLTVIHDALQRVNASRFLPATAIVMHPRRWGWLLDQSDSNGRPLLVNTGYGPQNAIGVGEAAAYGLAGQIAGVPVWTDANVPTTLSTTTSGNEDAILVYRRSDTHLWEDNLVPRQFRFDETLGGNLQIKLVVAGYGAFTAGLRPEGVAKISGSGFSTGVVGLF